MTLPSIAERLLARLNEPDAFVVRFSMANSAGMGQTVALTGVYSDGIEGKRMFGAEKMASAKMFFFFRYMTNLEIVDI